RPLVLVRTCQTLRTHAQANSRNFLSLALPRRNSSIFVGSVQLRNSDSVIAAPSTRPCVPAPAERQPDSVLVGRVPLLLRAAGNNEISVMRRSPEIEGVSSGLLRAHSLIHDGPRFPP